MCLVPPTFFLLGGGQVPPQQRGNPQLPCQCRGFPSSCSVPPTKKGHLPSLDRRDRNNQKIEKVGFPSAVPPRASVRVRPSVLRCTLLLDFTCSGRADLRMDEGMDGVTENRFLPLPLSESPLRQRPAVYIHRAHKPYMTVASVGRSVVLATAAELAASASD